MQINVYGMLVCVKKEKERLLVIHKTFLYDFTRNW